MIIKEFLTKSENNSLIIGIVGLGYVGLPLAEAYVKKNISVIGYDISKKRVDQLNQGKSGMQHIEDERVKIIIDKGLFKATHNPADLQKADAILVAVPTPLDIYHKPDLSYVKNTCHTLKQQLKQGQLVVLESTTYPGTTEDIMKPILEESGLKAGVDFFLAYSPEREDPGNPNFETATIPKVIGADSETERSIAKIVYDKIVKTVIVSNARTAEATKLVENIYRWINIAAVNEMKTIFEKMDIDIWEVIDAAKTKPFGFQAFYPGPGVGGHCIRIDPYYLSWKAREYGLTTQFIELAGEVNTKMPSIIITRLMDEMSFRLEKPLSGSKILVCGLAYKKNIDDIRESPALELIQILINKKATVSYFDPFIDEIRQKTEFPNLTGMQSIEWNTKSLKTFDAVIVATDHSNVDYEELCKCIPLIIDTRNALKDLHEKYPTSIVKA
jgi:UDP-N-acetyl-D-glucosamine dehydrogenase